MRDDGVVVQAWHDLVDGETTLEAENMSKSTGGSVVNTN